MTTPWQFHQDRIRHQEAALARCGRRAAQLAEVRLSRPPRRRTVAALLARLAALLAAIGFTARRGRTGRRRRAAAAVPR
jgi:hypothetical protein